MKIRLKLLAAALILSGSMATAAVTTEELVANLQADGYTFIEVKRGPTQIKIEAVKGTTKIESIIDAETGAVLKTETEIADARDQSRTGVQIQTRDRDFLRAGGGDGSDDGSDDGGHDDDSNSRSDRSDDDSDDHNDDD